ncbi:MAG TPA: GAF domain-containing protein, partial [Myxococcales bacterium]|nr:GAF domain-containing protein [Myxococcales bacterium]
MGPEDASQSAPLETAQLIRGFVGVAVAAQHERTEADFFRVVRESLRALGMNSTLVEVDGDRFRFAPSMPAMTDAGAEIRSLLDGWVPLARSGLEIVSTEGTLVEDLPGLLAAYGGVPRERFDGRVAARAVMTAIRVDGKTRYVLSTSGEHLDHAVASAFGLLGRQLGAALETMRRMEELERRNVELSLLLDLGRELVGAREVQQVLDTAVRTAARALRCSCAYVLLAQPDKPALVISAREDPEPPPGVEIGAELDLAAASMSALAFRTREPQATTDGAGDPRVSPEVVRRFRCGATLAVPLLSHRRALGVLALFERSERSFGAMDVRLATHAAQLIAAALENARLYAEQHA